MLEEVVIPFSRGSAWSRDWTRVSYTADNDYYKYERDIFKKNYKVVKRKKIFEFVR